MAYRFNDTAGRFIDERGRFVAESTVRAVVDEIADGASDGLGRLAQRLVDGGSSLAVWQAESMDVIKHAHLATAALANGGWAQMAPTDYGLCGRLIRDQYAYLRDFAAAIADGTQPLGPGVVARARQYGQAARTTFESTYRREQQRRGYRFERNVLGPAEHCNVCPGLARRGWVPIGTLPPIGTRPCRVQDRCSLRYSRTAQEAVA